MTTKTPKMKNVKGTQVTKLDPVGKTYARSIQQSKQQVSIQQSTLQSGGSQARGTSGTQVSTSGGLNSRFGRSRFLEKGFWTRRRKLCCVITGVTAIVFLLAVVFSLVAVSFLVKPLPPVDQQWEIGTAYQTIKIAHETVPPIIATTNIEQQYDVPDLTLHCVSKFGHCAYYKPKFVPDCVNMKCSDLTITVGMETEVFFDGLMRARANYRTASDRPSWTIKPPEQAPCLEEGGSTAGRCRNEKCEAVNMQQDKPLSAYADGSEVNGSYKETLSPQAEECVILPEYLSRIFPVLTRFKCGEPLFAKSSHSQGCVENSVHMLKCTGPRPSRGGQSCHQVDASTGLMLGQHAPVKLHPPCKDDECPMVKNSVAQFENLSCEKTQGARLLGCAYIVLRDSITRDDYQRCCLPDGGKGQCVAGRCTRRSQ